MRRHTRLCATVLLAGALLACTLQAHAQAIHIPPAASLPFAPLHGTLPGWLHTDGARIVDGNNHAIRLAAVNWYGGDVAGFAPGGLAYQPYMTILRAIKGLGFNTIRLPLSSELVERDPVVRLNLDANPSLRGLHALDLLDTLMRGARQVGLMVILVNQRSDAGGSRAQWARTSLLWYNPPRYTQRQWIADWIAIATRYRDNPAVIGYDLRNEPHSDGPGLEILSMGYHHHGATWGPFDGSDNTATDWRLAAQQAGNAILKVNAHALIIVEGIEIYPYRNPRAGAYCPYHIPATGNYCADLYWWGGNLSGAARYPVVLTLPHHLVYSPHEYGPRMHGQRWITPAMSEAAWQREMYRHWGYLLEAKGPDAAPIWVGEFGTCNYAASCLAGRGASQGAWFSALIRFLQRHPAAGWAYWPLNGTQPGEHDRGRGRGPGRREPYGLLAADWAHLSNAALLATLQKIQR